MASPLSPVEPLPPHLCAPNVVPINENCSPSSQTQTNQQTSQGGSGLMSSLKGGAGSLMKNIRDKSHSVIQTVQHSMATKGNISNGRFYYHRHIRQHKTLSTSVTLP